MSSARLEIQSDTYLHCQWLIWRKSLKVWKLWLWNSNKWSLYSASLQADITKLYQNTSEYTKDLFLDSEERCKIIIAVMYTTWASVKIEPKKNGMKGIWTHDLCDTDAVLYQLSYQAIWQLVKLKLRKIPVYDLFIYSRTFLAIYGCITSSHDEGKNWGQCRLMYKHVPVNMTVLPLDLPHSSMKCTTSPYRKDGCPANTTHGVLKQPLSPSVNTKEQPH